MAPAPVLQSQVDAQLDQSGSQMQRLPLQVSWTAEQSASPQQSPFLQAPPQQTSPPPALVWQLQVEPQLSKPSSQTQRLPAHES
jgi:hypothetical protein